MNLPTYVHYHSSYLFQEALDSKKRNNALACIIFSVASIEALLGDIAFTYTHRISHDITVSDQEEEIAKLITPHNKPPFPKVRDVYGQLIEKFSSKNKREMQILLEKIHTLFNLRNSIIHRHGAILSMDNSEGLPQAVKDLKGYVDELPNQIGRSGWLGMVHTCNEVASWSVTTTQNFINQILEILPSSEASKHLKRNAKLP